MPHTPTHICQFFGLFATVSCEWMASLLVINLMLRGLVETSPPPFAKGPRIEISKNSSLRPLQPQSIHHSHSNNFTRLQNPRYIDRVERSDPESTTTVHANLRPTFQANSVYGFIFVSVLLWGRRDFDKLNIMNGCFFKNTLPPPQKG